MWAKFAWPIAPILNFEFLKFICTYIPGNIVTKVDPNGVTANTITWNQPITVWNGLRPFVYKALHSTVQVLIPGATWHHQCHHHNLLKYSRLGNASIIRVTNITIVLVLIKVTLQLVHWSIQTLLISGGDSRCSWVYCSWTGPKGGQGVDLVDCNVMGGGQIATSINQCVK